MCPKILTIYGPLAIQSYGFMIVVGLLIFLQLTYNHPRRKKLLSAEQYLNTVFVSLLAGVIGGRTLGVIANWQSFKLNPVEIFYPWIGGFVVLGAIIGIVIVLPLYLKSIKTPILPFLDFAATYAPLLQAIARFGCLFAGCCYGAIAQAPAWWTVTFTNPDAHIPADLLGIPLLPTQLFAAAASAFIFIVMILMRRMFTRQGQAAFFYLTSENIARFAVDFLRGDRGDLYNCCGLNVSQFQLYSGLFFICCVAMFVVISFFGKPVKNDC